MLHLQFFFIAFFCLVDDRISSERDQLCQLMMIQECLDHSLGLLEAIESGNDRVLIKECDSLQVRLGLWPSSSTLKKSLYSVQCRCIKQESTYSRLPITRTFKGNRKMFELSGAPRK